MTNRSVVQYMTEQNLEEGWMSNLKDNLKKL
jgi:hypothetical protein